MATISKAHEVTARHHARFWLFTLDLAAQVDPNSEQRAALLRKLGVADLFIADWKLAEFAHRSGIPIGVLGPDLAPYAEQHKAVLHGFPGTKLWEGCASLHQTLYASDFCVGS
jgi:hypothetical protein